MARILVIQHLKYGDLVQTLPALAGFKRRRNDAEIWVLGQMPYAEVLRQSPYVDGILALRFESPEATPAAVNTWAHAAADVLPYREWDGIVNLSHGPLAGRLADLLTAKWKAGMLVRQDGSRALPDDASRLLFASVVNRRLTRIHISDFYRLMLRAGADAAGTLLAPREGELRRVAEMLCDRGWDGNEPLLVFQLGAGTPHKLWPVEYFARLGREVSDRGFRPVLIGSRDERPLAEAYLRLAPETAIDLVGELPVNALPALFRMAKAVVSTDTGPAHVAALSGCKVVGIYFSTAWVHETGPYGDAHWAWQVELPCGPCFNRTVCTERRCARMVTPDHVLWALEKARVIEATTSSPPSNFESARLFRSGVNRLGLLRFEPVYPSGRSAEDELAEMMSDAAVLPLAGEPNGDVSERRGRLVSVRWNAWIEELRRFAGLAQAAANECGAMLLLLERRATLRQLQQRNEVLRALDAQISETGEGATLPRTYLMEALRTLPGSTPGELAKEAGHVYRKAAEMAELALRSVTEWEGEDQKPELQKEHGEVHATPEEQKVPQATA